MRKFLLALLVVFITVRAATATCMNGTHITDTNSDFGGNVSSCNFYADGIYVEPISIVNWSQGSGDLIGIGTSPFVKVGNLYYSILVSVGNITGFPTNVSYFNNDAGYINASSLVPIFDELISLQQNISEISVQSNSLAQNLSIEILVVNNLSYNLSYDEIIINGIAYNLSQEEIARSNADAFLQAIIDSLSINDSFMESQINNISINLTATDSFVSNLTIIVNGIAYNLSVESSSLESMIASLSLNISLEALLRQAEIDSLNLSKSGIGNCPDGYFVQNLTSGTPECAKFDDAYLLSLINNVSINASAKIDSVNSSLQQEITNREYNDSYIYNITQASRFFEENVTVSVSGGKGNATTVNCCSGAVEIMMISVFPTTPSNYYRFMANTTLSGEMIDSDRIQHNGDWNVLHDGLSVIDENINVYIFNAAINENFRVRIRYEK